MALIALAFAGFAAYFGHTRTRSYSERRLRYTRFAERPVLSGLLAGIGTTLLAVPLVALAPVIGSGTAMALGLGGGSGLTRGVGGRTG